MSDLTPSRLDEMESYILEIRRFGGPAAHPNLPSADLLALISAARERDDLCKRLRSAEDVIRDVQLSMGDSDGASVDELIAENIVPGDHILERVAFLYGAWIGLRTEQELLSAACAAKDEALDAILNDENPHHRIRNLQKAAAALTPDVGREMLAAGVATRDEIPEQCGWQELSANGKTLLTRKKAPRRPMDLKHEAHLYKHLLMRHWKKGIPTREEWVAWLEQKRADRKLGRIVGREIQQTIKERIESVEQESRKLSDANDRLDSVKRALVELGLDPERVANGSMWAVEREVRRLAEARATHTTLLEADDLAEKASAAVLSLQTFAHGMRKLRAKVEAEVTAVEGRLA